MSCVNHKGGVLMRAKEGTIPKLALAFAMTVIGIAAFAQTNTANCYQYSSDSCISNSSCQGANQIITSNGFYCKQINIPYQQPGCCSYWMEVISYPSGTSCPCSGSQGTYITNTNLYPFQTCQGSIGGSSVTDGTCTSSTGPQ